MTNAKQKQFEKHVSELAESIKERTRLHIEGKQQLAATVEACEVVQGKKKELQTLVATNMREIQELHKEYFEILDAGWEKWNPNLIQRGEINEQESWRKLPAREHFQLTDAQWEKLLEKCPEPVMSVGRMADIIADLEAGKLKVKGIGATVIETIKDQFEKFWKKIDPVTVVGDSFLRGVKTP